MLHKFLQIVKQYIELIKILFVLVIPGLENR